MDETDGIKKDKSGFGFLGLIEVLAPKPLSRLGKNLELWT